MGGKESILAGQTNQDGLYGEALDQFGPALERLARAYEADPENQYRDQLATETRSQQPVGYDGLQ